MPPAGSAVVVDEARSLGVHPGAPSVADVLPSFFCDGLVLRRPAIPTPLRVMPLAELSETSQTREERSGLPFRLAEVMAWLVAVSRFFRDVAAVVFGCENVQLLLRDRKWKYLTAGD